MNIPITKHEDDRRILIEWNKDIPVKRCKVLTTKQKCILGKHYHNNSDSIFFILKGRGKYMLKSTEPRAKEIVGWMFEGDSIFVPRGIVHTFDLQKDTIMLEAASEPYDQKDEIQVS